MILFHKKADVNPFSRHTETQRREAARSDRISGAGVDIISCLWYIFISIFDVPSA
jgi:hypothetical protein